MSVSGVAGRGFLGLGDGALEAALLLALLAGGKRSAIFLNEVVDFVGVDEEDVVFAGFGRLNVAV